MRRRGHAEIGELRLGWQVLRVGEYGIGDPGSGAGMSEAPVLQYQGARRVGWR